MMRQLECITDSVDMILSNFWEIVKEGVEGQKRKTEEIEWKK